METKASYILVGVCTLLALLLFAGLLIFNAKGSNEKDLANYVIYFQGGVTGLSQGNAVLFHGVRIGSIKEISLDEKDQSNVRVVIEISSQVKMREDCQASLRAMGITGLTAVYIRGGSPLSPLLTAKEGEDLPVIPSTPSTIEHLAETLPALMQSAEDLAQRASVFLSSENAENLGITLASLAKISSSLADQTEKLEETLDNLNKASLALNKTLDSATGLIDNNLGRTSLAARRAFDRLYRMLDDLEPEIRRLANIGMTEVGRLLSDTRTLVQGIERLVRKIDSNPAGFFSGDGMPEYSPR